MQNEHHTDTILPCYHHHYHYQPCAAVTRTVRCRVLYGWNCHVVVAHAATIYLIPVDGGKYETQEGK